MREADLDEEVSKRLKYGNKLNEIFSIQREFMHKHHILMEDLKVWIKFIIARKNSV